MSDYVPLFEGDAFTCQASAAIVGGLLVAVSGTGTVATAGAAADDWVGVAAFDVAASGDKLTVHHGGVQRLLASGLVTAGDVVVCGAAGTVATLAAVTTPTPTDVTNTRAIVGIALTTGTDVLVEVKMER